jgi:hypothetical protein
MSRQAMNGVRVHLLLTKPQYTKIQRYSKTSGLPISELMRRAVDGFLAAAEKQSGGAI